MAMEKPDTCSVDDRAKTTEFGRHSSWQQVGEICKAAFRATRGENF